MFTKFFSWKVSKNFSYDDVYEFLKKRMSLHKYEKSENRAEGEGEEKNPGQTQTSCRAQSPIRGLISQPWDYDLNFCSCV